jgi:hypothetical protein
MIRIIAALAVLLSASIAYSQAPAPAPSAPKPAAASQDCKVIQEPTARLACFDKGPTPKATPKQAAKKPADEFAEAKAAMSRKLVDPESVRFTDIFSVSTPEEGPIVCGMLNSKNQMGGYTGARGFIYQPRSKLATLMLSGASDSDYKGQNAATYCVYCATDPRGDRDFSTHCPSLIKSSR